MKILNEKKKDRGRGKGIVGGRAKKGGRREDMDADEG